VYRYEWALQDAGGRAEGQVHQAALSGGRVILLGSSRAVTCSRTSGAQQLDHLSDMNKQGNPETLVSSHPGNTNAGKTGVYSSRMLAPRAAEIGATIADRPATEIRREVIQRDLAGLCALLEAVDAALAGRVTNSRDKAKDLLAIRLRLSKTIRAAAQEYEGLEAEADEIDLGRNDRLAEDLAASFDERMALIAERRRKFEAERAARASESGRAPTPA
jgi:hypothetical protein